MTTIEDLIEMHLKNAIEELLSGDERIAVLTEVSDCCRRLRFGPDAARASAQLLDVASHNLDEYALPRLFENARNALVREAAIDLLLVRAYLLELEKAGLW